MYFTCYICTTKLRFSSWTCGSVLRVLRQEALLLHLKPPDLASREKTCLFCYTTRATQSALPWVYFISNFNQVKHVENAEKHRSFSAGFLTFHTLGWGG